MPVTINDRPVDTVREEVVDQLIMNYSHGQLSYEAFERRLDKAMETTNNQELIDLVTDLELEVDKEYVETKKLDLGINIEPGEAEDIETIFNICSGSHNGGHKVMPKEIKLVSVLSGSELDLSEAIFHEPVLRIKLFSFCSGDKIYIPDNVKVISKTSCVLGSVDITMPPTTSLSGPTIIIEGWSILSGIDIKVKRTLKERFIDFAEQFKKLIA
jgi:hypothetical protein